MNRMFKELLDLFFPPICLFCKSELALADPFFCLNCKADLHRTNYHKLKRNPVEQHFYGRLEVEKATAFLHFKNGSRIQTILHEIKYQGNHALAIYMGMLCARELKSSSFFRGVDALIAVPIHEKKRKSRGYNQSEMIAEGISRITGIPLLISSLIKQDHTSSQTNKSRLERFENVGDTFALMDPEQINGKHLLLIDDVITTGSTLEACAQCLGQANYRQLSILTLAATD